MLTVDDPVFAAANLSTHGFWQQNEAAFIVAALTGLLGVLIGTGVGFWQWRQSHRAKQELERTRLDLGAPADSASKHRMARERIAWEEQQACGGSAS